MGLVSFGPTAEQIVHGEQLNVEKLCFVFCENGLLLWAKMMLRDDFLACGRVKVLQVFSCDRFSLFPLGVSVDNGDGRFGKDEAKVKEFLSQLFKNVPILDTGGRGATTTFVQRGIGDVLLTFEAEILTSIKESGDLPTPGISLPPAVYNIDQVTIDPLR